jgi:hypothetical protein
MPTLATEKHQRIKVALELEHAVAASLRREAAKRETTFDFLVRSLLDRIASDGLVDAVLDDAPPAP